jgi:hypothetical protein
MYVMMISIQFNSIQFNSIQFNSIQFNGKGSHKKIMLLIM